MHILLVDDDPALSEMLTEYLAGEGIKTTAAFNGPDGAAAALSGQYDAVILDVMLPGMDGAVKCSPANCKECENPADKGGLGAQHC